MVLKLTPCIVLCKNATLDLTEVFRDGAVARALVSHHCGSGSIPRSGVWVEFVASLLYTERFFPGTPVSPLV